MFWANLQVSSISRTTSSSLHQVGVPNCPTWCSSQASKSLTVGLVTGSFLSVTASCPQAWGRLPIYAGVLGYGWGNRPVCLGDVFDGSLGFRTLPDLPIALGNGPGVDFWNAPSSDYWTTSCTGYCSSCRYVTFP